MFHKDKYVDYGIVTDADDERFTTNGKLSNFDNGTNYSECYQTGKLVYGYNDKETFWFNLETEMEFECNEGHRIYAPWKKLRNKIECPICKANVYKNTEIKVPGAGTAELNMLLQQSLLPTSALQSKPFSTRDPMQSARSRISSPRRKRKNLLPKKA